MKAGCQTYFKHRVPAEAGAKSRYSLSFRKKIPAGALKPIITPSPLKGLLPSFSQGKRQKAPPSAPLPAFVSETKASEIPYAYPPAISPKKSRSTLKQSTVLFGTSITADIIADPSKGFYNVSRSGSFLKHIPEMMNNFHAYDSKRAADIGKVVFSVGTNDIKHDSSGSGMAKYRQTLINLVKRAQYLFPGCSIWFQSVLPMQKRYSYTTSNVLNFNKVLSDVCQSYGCNFLDCCRRFVTSDGRDYNKYLFRDWLHLNKWGMNLLCKIISYVLQ